MIITYQRYTKYTRIWQSFGPVKEKGKKGYFPFALLMADKERVVVPGMQTLSPQKVLEELEKPEIVKLEMNIA